MSLVTNVVNTEDVPLIFKNHVDAVNQHLFIYFFFFFALAHMKNTVNISLVDIGPKWA